MQTRTLGRAKVNVTRMGLGLAALGRPGYINLGHDEDITDYDVSAMEHHTHTMLDAAYNAGIRYFDAARSYGKAEQFLGSWLDSRQHNDVAIGSKWGYTYTANWQIEAEKHEVKEHSINVFNRQWSETQALLGDHLNLYQIHSATLSSGVLENHRVLDALVRLKHEQGILIGLSLSGDKQSETLEQAMLLSADGARIFDTVQVTWNLLERSTTEVLKRAHEAGMGVIIKEALANGRLTPRNNRPEFAEQYALLKQHADRLSTTVDALALAGVLARPWVDVVLSGAANVDHLRSNIAALQVAWDDSTERDLLTLVETPENYWRIRSNLAWN